MLLLATFTNFVVLICIQPTLSFYETVPGLYLGNKILNSDKTTLWSVDGSTYDPAPGGYNFTYLWRSNISAVHRSGLGLYNFQAGPNKYLSFQA